MTPEEKQEALQLVDDLQRRAQAGASKKRGCQRPGAAHPAAVPAALA
jgi:hypothetical protein